MCVYIHGYISLCLLNADNIGMHLIFSVCGVELLVSQDYMPMHFKSPVTFTALLL